MANYKEVLMSKNDKKKLPYKGDVQAVISMLPRLEEILKAHEKVTKAYQKYRQDGGDEISGLEKYLGCSLTCEPCKAEEKTIEFESSVEPEINKKVAEVKKTKKKEK